MLTLYDAVLGGLLAIGPKPADSDTQAAKKRYSEQMSMAVALAFADELRKRGLKQARPASPGELDASGAERRMSGGIGAKKVDVTWATEESGLLLGISVKTINFKDNKSNNFQNNLTNRRSDMLFEAVTLHRRFPYSVLGGLFILDIGASRDETGKRRSTFLNAHARMRLFTGRSDPAGRDEQYERLYILLVDSTKDSTGVAAYHVGSSTDPISLEAIILDLLEQILISLHRSRRLRSSWRIRLA